MLAQIIIVVEEIKHAPDLAVIVEEIKHAHDLAVKGVHDGWVERVRMVAVVWLTCLVVVMAAVWLTCCQVAFLFFFSPPPPIPLLGDLIGS
jgi:hypothetical protein